MLKQAFTSGTILLLFGCADPIDPIDSAKNILESGLLDNYNVEYRNTSSFPGDVVCGEVDTMDRWGNGPGYQRFMVRADRAYTVPLEDDWAFFCSEDQAAALQTRFGIDLMAGKNSNLQTVHRQLTAMDLALRQYLTDTTAFPLTLQELVSASTSSAEPNTPDAGGYIDEIPEDPWGRPYRYEKLRKLHPAPGAYKLYTLGKDGAAGGTGEDADIGNWHLQYLDHMADL